MCGEGKAVVVKGKVPPLELGLPEKTGEGKDDYVLAPYRHGIGSMFMK